jgi:hypothetical protein
MSSTTLDLNDKDISLHINGLYSIFMYFLLSSPTYLCQAANTDRTASTTALPGLPLPLVDQFRQEND